MKMSFGERLVLARKRKKLTQEELAQIIGINKNVYSRYERGVTPSIDVASRIAQVLELSLDYLVGDLNIELDDDIMRLLKKISTVDVKSIERILMEIDTVILGFKNKNDD